MQKKVNMASRKFVLLGVLLVTIAGIAIVFRFRAIALQTTKRRPNILLITLDTTRKDHLSCYGYPKKTTPALDQLAAESVKYEFAVSTSSWTLPAHASLFTGMLPVDHSAHYGVGENANKAVDKLSFYTLHPAFPTLAQQLSKAGYRTHAIISAPILHSEFGFSKGFETYDDDLGKPQKKDRTADTTSSLAITWLRQYFAAPKTQPFFLFLNFFDPHTPYSAPPPWGKDGLAADVVNVVSGHYDEVFRGNRQVTPEERELLIDQYDDEIRFMDWHLGQLFSEMKALGLYDDAMIVVTSDHGELFGEHNYLDHGHALYDELIRVPLIIKYPADMKKVGVISDGVSTRGIMPTLLSYLQLPIPPTADYGTLGGKRKDLVAESYRDIYYVQRYGKRFDRDQKAIYDGKYKFIWSSDGKSELYNIQEDPQENVNLCGRLPDVEKKLQSKLEPLVAESNQLNSLSTPQLDSELRRRLQALGYIQ